MGRGLGSSCQRRGGAKELRPSVPRSPHTSRAPRSSPLSCLFHTRKLLRLEPPLPRPLPSSLLLTFCVRRYMPGGVAHDTYWPLDPYPRSGTSWLTSWSGRRSASRLPSTCRARPRRWASRSRSLSWRACARTRWEGEAMGRRRKGQQESCAAIISTAAVASTKAGTLECHCLLVLRTEDLIRAS